MDTDSDLEFIEERAKKSGLSLKGLLLSVLLLFVVLLSSISYYLWFLNSPQQFDGSKVVTIEEGDSVQTITVKLQDSGVIKSAELLYLILLLNFDTTNIKASRYVFDEPLTTYQTAERLIVGDFDEDLDTVIIYEGESREKISDRLAKNFSWFDKQYFMEATEGLEGRLFPDTYYVPPSYTTEKLVDLLINTNDEVLAEYKSAISSSKFTGEEVLTLASIVEREANTEASMKLVAGIFLNRLEIGMALQADASIEYVLEHELNELRPGQLAESLREIDSPYNTYKYPGLPPTPIGNPGRTAIEAVLYPTSSDYLYYLTGNDGEFYYAKNYNQHLINIDRYLK